jgi:glyoxylate/hydroxypyruvate reductase
VQLYDQASKNNPFVVTKPVPDTKKREVKDMSFVICDNSGVSQQLYVNRLKTLMPERKVQIWPGEAHLPEGVKYALVWKPPAQLFETFKDIKAVFNLGAGVDALLDDQMVPDHLPIVRLIDPLLDRGMIEYVTWAVLRYHRLLHLYEGFQTQNQWKPLAATDARKTRVGILGLGQLGQGCAEMLNRLNLHVMGWSRSPKDITGVTSYHGEEGLNEMLAQSDILVCLLPLTSHTREILNAKLYAKLPHGAKVINVARGAHLIV